MVGIYSGSERLFYPMAGGKWKFGPPENAKLLRKLGGHEDIAVAMRSPNQCVLRYLMGFDNNALMPMYSAEKSYDESTLRQFRQEQEELDENIKLATDEGEYDLAEKYKRKLKKLKKELKKWTKGDLITPYKARSLNEGDPIKPITHRLRQAGIRVINGLIRDGFEDEAADLKDSYKVGDKSVVFYQFNSEFKWILAPIEKSCASRAP